MNRLQRVRVFLLLAFFASVASARPSVTIAGLRAAPSDFIFIFLLILALIIFFRSGRKLHEFYKPLVLYIAALILSTVFSVNISKSLIKLPAEIYLVLIPFVLSQLIETMSDLRKVSLTIAYFGTAAGAVSLSGAVCFYFLPNSFLVDFAVHHYGSLPVGNYPRLQGTFFYPSMFCIFLTFSTAFTFICKNSGWIKSGKFVIALAIQLLAGLLTLTPGIGGLLYIPFVQLLILIFHKFSNRSEPVFENHSGKLFFFSILIAVALMGATLIISAFVPWQINGTSPLFSLGKVNFYPSHRMLIWIESAKMFYDNPIFGNGLGTESAFFRFTPPGGYPQLLTDAHNIWLSIASQTGLLGLISFVYLIYSCFALGIKNLTHFRELFPLRVNLLLCLVSIVFIQGVAGSFEDARYLWILFGIILAVDRVDSDGH